MPDILGLYALGSALYTIGKVVTDDPNQNVSISRLGNFINDAGYAAVQVFTQGTAGAMAKMNIKRQSGYMKKSDLDTALNRTTVAIPANFAGLESIDVPTRLEEQLFEIIDVDEEENEVTITAQHIWYQLLQNNTTWKATEDANYTAAAVCKNILNNAITPVEFEVESDCTDTLPAKKLDYERKNIVEAFLDPEKGICKQYGLSLIRDNYRFYCLKEVGFDRGFVIEHGKNLLGIERQESIENLVTRVAPIAKDSKGNVVWMEHNGLKYIDSQYISNYRSPKLEIYDTGLQIGKDGVTAQNVQAKLLEAAQKRFSEDKVDLPEVTMTIEFVSLGDTEEYVQYRGLDKVYLYDILTIKDEEKGYDYSAQVIGVEHDILTGQLLSVKIGSLKQSDGSRKIAVWQVPEVDGTNIRLFSIQAGSYAPDSINGDDIADHVITYAHFASATIDDLNAETIQAVEANIETIIAGHITADSIKTTEISAINAKLGTATITNGLIDNADIGFAHIKAATAESLIARDAVTDRYFIDKLQVRNLQSVYATVGELVVKASDGNYYRLDVGTDGTLTATRVTLTIGEITAGVTSDGHAAIIETDLTVQDLAATNIKGINALIDKLTASRIDVDELFAREAFIGKLNTTDITSNSSLQIMVNKKNRIYVQYATPTDAHNNDLWYKQAPQPIEEMEENMMAQLENYPMWSFDGYELYQMQDGSWVQIDDTSEIRDTMSRLLMEDDRIDLAIYNIEDELEEKYTRMSGIEIVPQGVEVDGGTYVRIKSGGKFTVDSGNFDIDANGNVTMTGSVTAASGQIGGFYIGATRLSAGSSANYIAIDSGTANFDYFIMAGGETAANAKFLLTKSGNLTVESLTVRNEAGTSTEQINLSNYALWKLNYNVVKSYTSDSITLSNGEVINFNTAAGVVLSGGWTDNWTKYSVTATDSQGNVVGTQTSGAVAADMTNAQIKSALESASNHKATLNIEADGETLVVRTIDASGVYAAGSPSSGSASGRSGSSYSWAFSITKGDGSSASLSIDCSAIYADARSGYTQGIFSQYSGDQLYTMGQSGPQIYTGTLYTKA